VSARFEHEGRKDGFYRLERGSGTFSRSLTLPDGHRPEAIAASFDKGVLEVRIPKPEQRKPRRVEIAVGGRPPGDRGPRGRGRRDQLGRLQWRAMPALEITARDPATRARAGCCARRTGTVRTPAFVPLATKASCAGIEAREVEALGFDMVLGNTFHLWLDPGHELVAEFGGLHEFMGWDRPIITDSGGFQVFSMGHGNVSDEIKKTASGRGRTRCSGSPRRASASATRATATTSSWARRPRWRSRPR
jgi:hypothetical protein